MKPTLIIPLLIGLATLHGQERIVELPPVLVEESVRGRPWLYAELPGIVVLSRCSQSLTIDFIRAQSRAIQLSRLVVPDDLRGQVTLPHLYILSPPSMTATAQKELLKDAKGAIAQEAAAKELADALAALQMARAGRVGPVMPLNMRTNQIRFLSNLQLSDADEGATYVMLDDTSFDAEHLRISNGAMKAMIDSRAPALPAWLRVGLETHYASTLVSSGDVTTAASAWVSPVERAALAKDKYYPRTLSPMMDILESDGPADADGSERAVRWRAQAGLFVRWGLRGQGAENFWKFARRAAEAGVSENLVKESFNLGYADLRDTLSDYLPIAVAEEPWTIDGRTQRVSGITTREARPDEIARLKGEWERLEVAYVAKQHPEFLEGYIGRAEADLGGAYRSGDRNPQLLATYGLLLCDTGSEAEAMPILEEAARAPNARARVLFEVSRLRFQDALTKPDDGAGRISAAQVARALELIPRIRALQPPLADMYRLVSAVWSKSAVRPSAADLAVIDEGIRFFPGDPGLRGMRKVLE